jgi:hypothetical protein
VKGGSAKKGVEDSIAILTNMVKEIGGLEAKIKKVVEDN